MFDPTIILIIPALLLALYAQGRVSSAYNKYSKVPNRIGITGAEAARRILNAGGLYDVRVEETDGHLSDHYDPKARAVRLSQGNYRNSSVAAVSIAAHETGHALQHAQGYGPLALRHAIVPVANIGSMAAFPLAIIGLILGSSGLFDLGILLFTGVILFHCVTLPVEFNASRRAIALLLENGMIDGSEQVMARKVLGAAALTYVAAAAMALMQLVRLLILRNMSDD